MVEEAVLKLDSFGRECSLGMQLILFVLEIPPAPLDLPVVSSCCPLEWWYGLMYTCMIRICHVHILHVPILRISVK